MQAMTSSRKGIRCFASGGITLAVVLLLAANAAHAVPVEWTLNNWNLTGGDTVTGSFIYEADTDTFSNISILSDGTSFTFAGVNADVNNLEFVTGDPFSVDLTDTSVMLGALVSTGMTNDPQEALFILAPRGLSICTNADCSASGSPGGMTSGNITGTIVPEPSTAALMALGLVGLVAGRRSH